jgi:hypothetical protein
MKEQTDGVDWHVAVILDERFVAETAKPARDIVRQDGKSVKRQLATAG